MKICFLASGNGGNLKFFHLAINKNILKNIELSVISDRHCGAIVYAQSEHILFEKINYTRDKNKSLLDILEKINPDFIITNWYKILDNKVVNLYRKKLVNLHYSLLPSFSGLIGIAPIEEAYKKNCQFAGATCHFVNKTVDSGMIISQSIVSTDQPIKNAITDIFRSGCLILLNSLLILSNEEVIDMEIKKSFYFSPELKFNKDLFDDLFWEELSGL